MYDEIMLVVMSPSPLNECMCVNEKKNVAITPTESVNPLIRYNERCYAHVQTHFILI